MRAYKKYSPDTLSKLILVYIALIVGFIFLVSCNKSVVTPNTILPTPINTTPTFIIGNYIGKTSYDLRKTKEYLNVDSIQRSFGIQNTGYWNGSSNVGYAYVDLNADGLDDIVYPVMTANTEVPMKPFVFLNNGSRYVLDNSIIPTDYIGATDTRKTLICDFNNDSLPDVFFNNTANEQSPNQNQIAYQAIMLSVKGDKKVTYKMGTLPTELVNKGGYHGAAAGDLNGDKNADIIFVGQGVPKVLYGKGDGTFTFGIFNTPSYKNGYITAEIVDVDNDGKNDVLLAGAENNDKAKIFWGKTNFTTSTIINDIKVNELELIVDVSVEDIDNDGIKEIMFDRTFDGLNGLPFYRGYYLTVYKTNDNHNSYVDVTNNFFAAKPLQENNVTGGWIPRINITKDVNGILNINADINGCYQYKDYRFLPYIKKWKQNPTTKIFE